LVQGALGLVQFLGARFQFLAQRTVAFREPALFCGEQLLKKQVKMLAQDL
jgi:hypothetical protein